LTLPLPARFAIITSSAFIIIIGPALPSTSIALFFFYYYKLSYEMASYEWYAYTQQNIILSIAQRIISFTHQQLLASS
jgi:uncharacterized protein YqgC (DUF456 family)